MSSDNGNNMTFEVPSLRKTAYYACNKVERAKYDSMETPDVGLQRCCVLLFEVLRGDHRFLFENDDARETMSNRSNDLKFEDICEYAAVYGHIDCLRLAGALWHSRFKPTSPTEIVDKLLPFNKACEGIANTCTLAAATGHLDCLAYARDNGCPWDKSTCREAAFNGHLDCLAYARDNGCPWDESTCTEAAVNGHLNCLIYARDNGCPWDFWTSINAKFHGHMDCFDYALKNGCPWEEWIYDSFVAVNS